MWIDKAIDRVEPYAPGICLRGDVKFALTKNFDRWSERVDLLFGMEANGALVRRAEALRETSWRRLKRKPKYTTKTGQKRQRS
ncbi:MAG: IS1380 family transposase, partial [Thermoanaerobaculia bacterium]